MALNIYYREMIVLLKTELWQQYKYQLSTDTPKFSDLYLRAIEFFWHSFLVILYLRALPPYT
jgi:hypothetical protein